MKRELLHRSTSDVTVQVVWDSDKDSLSLVVKGRSIKVDQPINRDEAMLAFDHPFCFIKD